MPRQPGDAPPIHAGEILLESFLEPPGITQAQFAKAIVDKRSNLVAGSHVKEGRCAVSRQHEGR